MTERASSDPVSNLRCRGSRRTTYHLRQGNASRGHTQTRPAPQRRGQRMSTELEIIGVRFTNEFQRLANNSPQQTAVVAW